MVLVSRSQQKLSDLSKQLGNKHRSPTRYLLTAQSVMLIHMNIYTRLESKNKIQTKTVAVDFSENPNFDSVKNAINGLEVGILGNKYNTILYTYVI